MALSCFDLESLQPFGKIRGSCQLAKLLRNKNDEEGGEDVTSVGFKWMWFRVISRRNCCENWKNIYSKRFGFGRNTRSIISVLEMGVNCPQMATATKGYHIRQN